MAEKLQVEWTEYGVVGAFTEGRLKKRTRQGAVVLVRKDYYFIEPDDSDKLEIKKKDSVRLQKRKLAKECK